MKKMLFLLPVIFLGGCGLQENGKYAFILDDQLVYRLDTSTGEIVMIRKYGQYYNLFEDDEELKKGVILLSPGGL